MRTAGATGAEYMDCPWASKGDRGAPLCGVFGVLGKDDVRSLMSGNLGSSRTLAPSPAAPSHEISLRSRRRR